jgi:hypothetical protein
MKKTIAALAISAFALTTSSAAFAAHPILFPAPNQWAIYNGPGTTPPYIAINGTSPDDTTPAVQTLTETFSLNGTVAKDCSYFGAPGGAHTVNIGAIGVKNGNNETAADAFEQNGPIQIYDLDSTSAGCNFNNTVSLTKSVNGLVNASPGGYDSSEFTANIPYEVTVGIAKAVNADQVGTGIYHAFTVATNSGSGSMHLGAWRSNLDLKLLAPAQNLGLVAGTYTDTMTLTLAVDTI